MSKKSLRAILLFISTLMIISCFNSPLIPKSNVDDEFKKIINESIGEYRLVLNESKIPGKEQYTNLKDLKLNLNSDMTFLFSRDYPFLFDSSGYWKVDNTTINRYLVLNYKRNHKHNNHISCCCTENMEIDIKFPDCKDKKSQAEILVFKKE